MNRRLVVASFHSCRAGHPYVGHCRDQAVGRSQVVEAPAVEVDVLQSAAHQSEGLNVDMHHFEAVLIQQFEAPNLGQFEVLIDQQIAILITWLLDLQFEVVLGQRCDVRNIEYLVLYF